MDSIGLPRAFLFCTVLSQLTQNGQCAACVSDCVLEAVIGPAVGLFFLLLGCIVILSCAFQISRNPHHGPVETIHNSSISKQTTDQSQRFPSSSHSRRMEHGNEVVQNHQLVENPTPNTFEQPDASRSDLQDLHMEEKTIVYHLEAPTIDTHAPAGNGSSCTMGEGPLCFRTPPPAVLSSHTKA
jgi:hypothetical protein